MTRAGAQQAEAGGAHDASPPAVRERPILFQGRLVRAILAGDKTVTRRPVKPPASFDGCLTGDCPHDRQAECDSCMVAQCPYGAPGDRLWVRETWHQAFRPMSADATGAAAGYVYRADDDGLHMNPGWTPREGWRPSIFMPRAACRLVLEVTNVCVERLQALTAAEAQAEGAPAHVAEHTFRKIYRDEAERGAQRIQCFREGWERLYAKRSALTWNADPWVWVVRFKRVEAACPATP